MPDKSETNKYETYFPIGNIYKMAANIHQVHLRNGKVFLGAGYNVMAAKVYIYQTEAICTLTYLYENGKLFVLPTSR